MPWTLPPIWRPPHPQPDDPGRRSVPTIVVELPGWRFVVTLN
jgi:hypothetical protein